MSDPPTSQPEVDCSPRVPPPRPTWVKALAIVGVVLLLLIGAMLLFGGGNHGPGRHAGVGGSTAIAGTGEPHAPPRGDHVRPVAAHAP